MQPASTMRSGVTAAVVPCLILLAVALVEPNFSYNRWDNFEYCTPVIWAAHSQWLRGMVPHWNPHQHLGEPFTLAMLAGVFYFPYTLCCLLIRLCGLPASALPLFIVVTHTAFAAFGWDRLLSLFEVRPAIRLLVSSSAVLGGFVTCVSAVWIFVAPFCAWLPWLLYALLLLLHEPRKRGAFVLLACGFAQILCVGHLQFAAYAGLFVGIFAAGYATLVLRRPQRLVTPAMAAAIGVMVAAPFWLPAMRYLKNTAGMRLLSVDEFLAHAATPVLLTDLLLPVYSHFNGFLPNPIAIYGHQGSWVVPALLGGLVILRKRRSSLTRPFLLALACAALFFLLSLGEKGGLLRLTYGLPLWSSFRGTFKFLPFSLAAIALAAGLGLEMVWQEGGGVGWRKALGFGLAALAAALLARNIDLNRAILPSLRTWSGVLSLVAGLVILPATLLATGRARRITLAAAFVQLVALVVLCHHQELKRYLHPYGAVGPAQLDIDNRYRVLPLSPAPAGTDLPMEEYAVFHSATANGYFSASGHHTRYLLPRWYETWLPVDEMGVLPVGLGQSLTAGNLLRSANVRYYIVAKSDYLNLHSVTTKGLRRIRELRETFVYEDPQALPRIYFATEVHPYGDHQAPGIPIDNRRPATAAVVEGWPHPGAVATGEVLHTNWDHHLIRAAVSAPQGGFLVVSTTWYPGWSATVDGKPAALYRANGTLLGLAVPAGGRDVALRFTPPGWKPSLALAAMGLVAMAAWGYACTRF